MHHLEINEYFIENDKDLHRFMNYWNLLHFEIIYMAIPFSSDIQYEGRILKGKFTTQDSQLKTCFDANSCFKCSSFPYGITQKNM